MATRSTTDARRLGFDDLVEHATSTASRQHGDPLGDLIPDDVDGGDGEDTTAPPTAARSALSTDAALARMTAGDGGGDHGDASTTTLDDDPAVREFVGGMLPELARHDPPADPGPRHLHGGGDEPSTSNTRAGAVGTMAVRAASAPVDGIVDAYYSAIPETSFAWVRELWVGDGEDGWTGHLIVEDDAGHLWLVRFRVDGDDVEFDDDPQRVAREYRPTDDENGDRESVAVQASSGTLVRRFTRPTSNDARPAEVWAGLAR